MPILRSNSHGVFFSSWCYVFALSLFLIFSSTLLAQRRPKTAAFVPSKTATQIDVHRAIAQYDFSAASQQLQKLIAIAPASETDSLKRLLRRCEISEALLSATHRVVWIDSVVVEKRDFLSQLPLSEESGSLKPTALLYPEKPGRMVRLGGGAFINALRRKLLFSAADSLPNLRLFSAYRIGEHWSQPELLLGIDSRYEEQDYPFMLADGVTLYFAAKGSESIGGYDLFVTRYSPEKGQYLQAANLGMPFNSPANDYLYAIDPETGLGLLVTDRRQPQNKVCIYTFIQPKESNAPIELSASSLKHDAQIWSIADSQRGEYSLIDAVQSRLNRTVEKVSEKDQVQFILNDRAVYTKASDFRSSDAQKLFPRWQKAFSAWQKAFRTHRDLQERYARSRIADLRSQLQQYEVELPILKSAERILAQQIRQAERPTR